MANGQDQERPELIFQVAAVKGNDVIIQNTTICARDHQHALVKAAALVSAVKDEDAGAADIRYCVSQIQDTQANGSPGGY